MQIPRGACEALSAVKSYDPICVISIYQDMSERDQVVKYQKAYQWTDDEIERINFCVSCLKM